MGFFDLEKYGHLFKSEDARKEFFQGIHAELQGGNGVGVATLNDEPLFLFVDTEAAIKEHQANGGTGDQSVAVKEFIARHYQP